MKRRVPFAALLVVVLVFAVIAIEPPMILLGGFLIYALSGPCNVFLRKKKPTAGN